MAPHPFTSLAASTTGWECGAGEEEDACGTSCTSDAQPLASEKGKEQVQEIATPVQKVQVEPTGSSCKKWVCKLCDLVFVSPQGLGMCVCFLVCLSYLVSHLRWRCLHFAYIHFKVELPSALNLT